MNKERLNIELSYLKKLVAGLKTLKESQFVYDDFVTEYDEENECGTVCCALGWMPKFVPESGVKWGGCLGLKRVETEVFTVFKTSENVFMFFGQNTKNHDSDKFGNGYYATLPQVINRIEHVISLYKTNN